MLALGAGLGGLATEYLGTDAVFVLDSFTYLVSAFFIFRTAIPQDTADDEDRRLIRTAYKKIGEGWAYIRGEPSIGRIALAKATWAVGGGATVYMLTLLGQEVMPEAQAAGIGVLFFARGLGTGVGPVIAKALFRDQRYWPAVLGMSVAISGVFYLTLGFVRVQQQIEAHYAAQARAIARVDGLGMEFDDWRFNLRASNTEPLLRLNVETRGDIGRMQARTRELLELIGGEPG
jgi:hypothetical protein